MNMYKNIDRKKFQFDLYTPFYCDNEKFKREIEQLGGKIFVSNGSFNKFKRKIAFLKGLKKFLAKNKYSIIHIHSGSIFALAYGAKIAKRSGANKVIVHSHCTGIKNISYKIIKRIADPVFLKYATDYMACSKIAAEWKFPKKILEDNKYSVIKNGIDLEKFKFSDNIRNEYRKKLDIENKYVICNIGRFTLQKNQMFLLDIFYEVCKDNKQNTVLLLIGNGELEDDIKTKAKKLELMDKIIFLENRNDINKILQAADIFVFPSLFEGLGIVTIEAQATGLKTLCSENIPNEAIVTDLFEKININEGAKHWARQIIDLKNKKVNREQYYNELKKAEYNAEDAAKKLEKTYINY